MLIGYMRCILIFGIIGKCSLDEAFDNIKKKKIAIKIVLFFRSNFVRLKNIIRRLIAIYF